MKKYLLGIGLAAMIFSSCNDSNQITEDMSSNPLLTESVLPYGAPDFTKIKSHHFLPAMKEAMKIQNEKIDVIVNNTDAPTFENVIIALEKSGADFDRVSNVFYALTGAHTNDDLKAAQKELSSLTAAHFDGISLNDALFKKVKAIYDNKASLNLDEESAKLLEEKYSDFVLAGAELDAEKKSKLKSLNEKLANLRTEFNQTLLVANNAAALEIEDKGKLAGLTESEIAALINKDNNKCMVNIINTTQQPMLTQLTDRDMRQKLFEASYHRADHGAHDLSNTIKEIADLRVEKAELLGYNNYAEWTLKKSMAKTPEKVISFIEGLTPAAVNKANAEAKDISEMIAHKGHNHDLKPWDWNHYAEDVKKAKYDLDENEIKPYFELFNVLENGVFYAATKLYGITFKKRTDIPTYHEDIVVYELFDKDGTELGLFYGDYFARPSKRGGAWMSNFVTQSHMFNKKPVIYNVCNYVKPSEGKPALISFDDVTTLFHEFGHALHGFFADQKYPSLSGTATARDFVEFPSQFNENWALYPEILDNYAKHYETGAPMPKELVAKIKKASTFNQGYSLTELLSATTLDMAWHTQKKGDDKIEDIAKWEEETLKNKGFIPSLVPPRYRSTYFSHVFGGGYASGYYAYQWTEMLAHDAYNWFENNGGLTRANGDRYRNMVISRGNTKDYETMYKAFRGQDPELKHYMKARGLK